MQQTAELDGAAAPAASPADSDSPLLGLAIVEGADWKRAVGALLPSLRAFAWSLARNGADADDLVQETLVKAWTHRDKFQAGTNLRAWLFTILRNTFYTTATRRRRETNDTDGVLAGKLTTPATQEWSVAVRALRTALDGLPDEHREALILVTAAGLSYEEAADICGCALGTIKSRVNRARAKLMKLMNVETVEETLVSASDGQPVRPALRL